MRLIRTILVGIVVAVALVIAVGFAIVRSDRVADSLAPLAGTTPLGGSRSGTLSEELDYLRDIAEISWVHFEGQTVYIGVTHPIPDDLRLIVRAAAMHGSRVVGGSVSVFAVDAGSGRGGRGLERRGQLLCGITARPTEQPNEALCETGPVQR